MLRVFAEKVQEALLALDLWEPTEVAIPPKKVEGIENQPILTTAGEFGLQFREVGTAVLHDHYLTVDDRLTGKIEGTGDDREPFGPIQACG